MKRDFRTWMCRAPFKELLLEWRAFFRRKASARKVREGGRWTTGAFPSWSGENRELTAASSNPDAVFAADDGDFGRVGGRGDRTERDLSWMRIKKGFSPIDSTERFLRTPFLHRSS
jgi:hypothetical protein